MRNSLILIGMPGAGKSSVGVLAAKYAALGFVDTDVLLQTHTGERLQQTLDRAGYQALRRLEEQVILGLAGARCVIATGGSAVYSPAAMAHLRQLGRMVFLDVPLEVLRPRLADFAARGIAGPPGRTLAEVYAERQPLYQRYAQITIACADRPAEAIAREVAALAAAGPRPPSPG